MSNYKVYGRKKRRSKKKEDSWKDCPYVEETEYPSEKKIFVGFNSNALFPARPIGTPPVQFPVPTNIKYEVVDLLSDDSRDTVIMKYSDEENIKTKETVSDDLQNTQQLQDLCGGLSEVCHLGKTSGTSTNPVKCENEIFSLKNLIKEDFSGTESDESGDTVILNSRDCIEHLEENCISHNTNVKKNNKIPEYSISNGSTLINSNLLSEKECMPLETKTQSTSEQKQIQPLLLNYSQCIKVEPESDSLPSTNSTCSFTSIINVDNSVCNILDKNCIAPVSNLLPRKESKAVETVPQCIESNELFVKTEMLSDVTSSINKLCCHEKVGCSCFQDISMNHATGTNYSVLENSNSLPVSVTLQDNSSTIYNEHLSSQTQPLKENSNHNKFIKTEPLTEMASLNKICDHYEVSCSCSQHIAVKDVTGVSSNVLDNTLFVNALQGKSYNQRISSEMSLVKENPPEAIGHSEFEISSINKICDLNKIRCFCSEHIDVKDATGTSCSVLDNNSVIFVNSLPGKNFNQQSQFIKSEPPTESNINKLFSQRNLDDSYCLPNVNVTEDIEMVYSTTDNNIISISNFIPEKVAASSHSSFDFSTVIEIEPKCFENSNLFIKTEPPISNLLLSKQPQIGSQNNMLVVKQNPPQFMEYSNDLNKTESPTKDVEKDYKNANTLMSISHVLSAKRIQPSNQQTQSYMPAAKKMKLQPFEYGRVLIKTEPVSEVVSTFNSSCKKFNVTLDEPSSSTDPAVVKQVEFSVPLNSFQSGNDSSNDFSETKLLSLQNISTNLNKSGKHFPTRIKIESLDKGPELPLHNQSTYTSNFTKASNEHLKLSNSPSIKGLPVPNLAPKLHTSNLEPMQDPNLEFSKDSAKFLTLNINFDENDIKDTINYITENYLYRKRNLIDTAQPLSYGNISSLSMDKKADSFSSSLTNEELKEIIKNASMISTPNSSDDSVQINGLRKSDGPSKRQIVENDVSNFENDKYKKLKH